MATTQAANRTSSSHPQLRPTRSSTNTGTARRPAPKHTQSKKSDQNPNLKAVPKSTKPVLGAAVVAFLMCLLGSMLLITALHAYLVNQAAQLDNLNSQNVDSREELQRLRTELVNLDSTEGVAQAAVVAGMVSAPEVVVITPVDNNTLLPPLSNPFGLEGLNDPSDPNNPNDPAGTQEGIGEQQ